MTPQLAAQLLLTAHRNVRMRQLGDLPGHEFHGNQWTAKVGDLNDFPHLAALRKIANDPRIAEIEGGGLDSGRVFLHASLGWLFGEQRSKSVGSREEIKQAMKLLRHEVPKTLGDLPGHEFHGNQWTAYHGTTAENAAKILKEGLKPDKQGDIWTTTDLIEARTYARAAGNNSVILKINVPAHDTTKYDERKGGKTLRVYKEPLKAEYVSMHSAHVSGGPFGEWKTLSAIPVSSRDLTPLHKAADAHYASIMLAVSAAFMRGKKALRASLRGAEFNPDEPRDEKGQWTSGGVQPEEKAIAERLGLPTTYSGTDSMTSLSGRLNPESARAYFAGKAVDNPIPKNKTLTMEQAQRLPIMMSGETKEVSIAPLRSTQDYIQPSAVEKYKNGEGMTSRPVVATIHGEEVLLNGNHNVLAAQLRGQDTIKVQHLGDFSKHADYIKKVDAQGGGFTSLSASPNISAAVSAIRASLVHDLPPALEKAYVAGGGTVGGLKAAGDVEGHPFHGNQWTEGGGTTREEKIARIKEINTQLKPILSSTGGNLTAKQALQVEKMTGEIQGHSFDIAKPITPEKVAENIAKAGGTAAQNTMKPETIAVAQHDLLQNKDVYSAITKSATGSWFNRDTPIDDIMNGKNPKVSADQFRATFEKTRETLRAQYGDKVPAYRATTNQRSKATQNWATTREFAANFGKNIVERSIPISSIIGANVGLRGTYHELIVDAREIRGAATKFKMQFDAKNSNAATWALTHATQIADDISQTSKDNIALAVARAQEEGDLGEQYDEILDAVGDEARASLIARTESMTAVNEGQRDAWDQALEKGLLTEDNRVVWIATSDACPECEELDGEERTLDGEYPGDGGDGPPLHPNCRCTEGIVG
jgi:hypothetical protein